MRAKENSIVGSEEESDLLDFGEIGAGGGTEEILGDGEEISRVEASVSSVDDV